MEKSKKEVDPRRICKYFQSGSCRHGKACSFLHLKNYVTVCQFFLKGNCRKGSECKNIHPESQLNNKQKENHEGEFQKIQPKQEGEIANLGATESKITGKLEQKEKKDLGAVQEEEGDKNSTIIPKRNSGRFKKRFLDLNKLEETKEIFQKNNELLWGELGYFEYIKTQKSPKDIDLAQFFRKFQSSLVFLNEERTRLSLKYTPTLKREDLNIDFEIDEGFCIFEIDLPTEENASVHLMNSSIPEKFRQHFNSYMNGKLRQSKLLFKLFRDTDNKLDVIIEEIYEAIKREQLKLEEEERARVKAEEEAKEKEEYKQDETHLENEAKVWTQQEQLLLEQGMIKNKDIKDPREKWSKIADEVKTKSMQECLERAKEIKKRIQTLAEEKLKPKSNQDDGDDDDEEEDQESGDEEGDEEEEYEDSEEDENDRGDSNDSFGSDEDHVMYIEADNKNLEEKYGIELPILLTLSEMNLRNIAFGKLSELHLTLKCRRCKYTNDLTVRKPEESENYLLNNIICLNCNTPSSILVKLDIFHKERTVCARIGTINWDVLDTLQADFIITCEACAAENFFKKYVCGTFLGKNCMNCHGIIEFSIASYGYERETISLQKKNEGREKNVLDALTKQIDMLMKKKKVGNFKLGQPLPKNGACRHYKLSYRYFRFPCCGKAYPCDDCHNMIEKEHDQELAKSMICGFCSYEQPIKETCGKCGGIVTKSSVKKGHWEGGKGCRDKKLMSNKDAHKFAGVSKTVSRKKLGKTKN